MHDKRSFFATAPKGIEPLLAEELKQMGASQVAEGRAGVSFQGAFELAFRACLWSRLANRILLPLKTFLAATPEELYEGTRSIDWRQHLTPSKTLAVDCSISRSQISHSRYGALKVKDAIVDQFRDISGMRPSVDVSRPDVRINVYIHWDQVTLSLDLSGESLHRRGYREEGVLAPLKENLASAILLRAGWPSVAKRGGALLDPMCGSGTLPLEAALMAGDVAPGLMRSYFGFLGWEGHDPHIWEELLDEARGRRDAGLEKLPPIAGFDADPRAIKAAWANAERAGLQRLVHFEKRELASLEPFPSQSGGPGLLVVNPPYGERLGEVESLKPLYASLGEKLKEHFRGWKAAVFTGNPELGKNMALRARRIHTLYNGALKCQLLHFDIDPKYFFREQEAGQVSSAPTVLSPGAEMFANRLRKNLRNIGRWARRSGISCYRLYDADMPEYAVAVDVYEQWAHIQEYQAPKTVSPEQAQARLKEVMTVLPDVLDIPHERIFLKVRRQQKGTVQYGKFSEQGKFHEVSEGECRFLVNFSDYLDTGLFLDHRITRQMIQELAKGKRFLNLFAYTGTATVYAARGGARSTVTVDMSRTYLDWAKKNLALNGFSENRHSFVQADCLKWMEDQKSRFDLIFLDPPTFSNSKSMSETFDVQRDHVKLLNMASRLLSRDGVLIFSNNFSKFKMDAAALTDLKIEDITRQTIPKDFERNHRIHNCWKISLR